MVLSYFKRMGIYYKKNTGIIQRNEILIFLQDAFKTNFMKKIYIKTYVILIISILASIQKAFPQYKIPSKMIALIIIK